MTSSQSLKPIEDQVLDAIISVVGPRNVPLHGPSFDGNEWIYLKECLDSTFVSSAGKFVDRFESDLVNLTGAKNAKDIAESYLFITNLISNHNSLFYYDINEEIKQKKKKIK